VDRVLTLDDFRPRLNETFHLQTDAAPMDLALSEAVPVGSQPLEGERTQAFSLLFTGPSEPLLAQQIYRMAHPEMGEIDIFLVPVGSDSEGVQYEAVFA
jgi:hypothetical protein